MATLSRRGDRFYLQFYSPSKSPQFKKVALGQITAKTANRIKERLQDQVKLGEYDPWGEPSDIILDHAIDVFMSSKSKRSPQTVRSYVHVLRMMADHAGSRLPVRSITQEKVYAFLESTSTNAVSKSTYARQLRVFWRWCVKSGYTDRDIIYGMPLESVPTKFPKLFTEQDIDRLIRSITEHSIKNRMVTQGDPRWLIPIMVFAIETGLRRGELCSLKWDDVGSDGITVYGTKSKGDRRVPLTRKARGVLDGIEPKMGIVFRTSAGSEIYPPYLSRLFRKQCVRAGLDNTSFHTLRHTACSRLAARGVPVEVIRRYAGHSSILVTQKYMHLSDDGFSSWFKS